MTLRRFIIERDIPKVGTFERQQLREAAMADEELFDAMVRRYPDWVSRQEFLAYMGTQYDMMDSGKKGMLTAPQFMDKKMMAKTFAFPSSPSESGPNR